MNILIVDDEDLAREQLKHLIKALGEPYQVVAEAASGEEALAIVQRQAIDLILLDIQMPGMDGLELAQSLAQIEPPPAIIFITAYPDYALPAFETPASAYLLKPVRLDKLQAALAKISRPNRAQLQKKEAYFTVHYRGRMERIPFSEIYYFHADHKYTVIRHRGGEALIEDSLKKIEQRFPQQLLRIHRSTLVVLDKVKGLEKSPIGRFYILFNEIEDRLEISRRHVAQVRRLLKNN